MTPTGFAGLSSRFDLEKPIIAAVNGFAMGGGFETALSCDIILASDNAKFALPEVKVGFFAAASGVQRLSRYIGRLAAQEMMFTGPHDRCGMRRLKLGCVQRGASRMIKLMAERWKRPNRCARSPPRRSRRPSGCSTTCSQGRRNAGQHRLFARGHRRSCQNRRLQRRRQRLCRKTQTQMGQPLNAPREAHYVRYTHSK